MSQNSSLSLPSLPASLHWHGTPQNWNVDANGALTITAGPKTDWFVDPESGTTTDNAPAAIMPVRESCMLQALVTADHTSMYDAGVLAIYQSDQVWAKLCLELSPQGQVMIVSVVTRSISDDCNSYMVAGNTAYLRLAMLDRAYAFHYSIDGKFWNLIRYFTLGEPADTHIGFLAQSPTGGGCTAVFREIAYVSGRLRDIRSGE